jgi:ferrochelatase
MINKNRVYLLVNFGGPRNMNEIGSFLESLLTDRDVIWTNWPTFFHNFFFRRLAKKRSLKVSQEYEHMGGKSPIFFDTETVAEQLRKRLNAPVFTFHRYLPASHRSFVETIEEVNCDEIRIFPMFPQFTYATTGGIARWFQSNLSKNTVNKMRWIKSYPTHPAFIKAHQNCITDFLDQHRLIPDDVILLFSAHGIPQKFVNEGDIYEDECSYSMRGIMQTFPNILGRLAYQSRFGQEEWIKPYTIDVCKDIHSWRKGRESIVFIPISFTSDHIETLCEIENDYMTVIREKNLKAYRIPALTLNDDWLNAIAIIIREHTICNNQMLVRT